MKNQALFSWKDKSKKLKCRLLQFLFGALKVNSINIQNANFILHAMVKRRIHSTIIRREVSE